MGIHAFAFRCCLDGTSAEDIEQETFIKASLALTKLRAGAAFKSWLYRIARNTATTGNAVRPAMPSASRRGNMSPPPQSSGWRPRGLTVKPREMETEPFRARSPINWRWLVPGFLLTGVVAWGVHSVLLEVCKVPYPEQLPRTGIVPFLNYAVSVAALFVFCRLAAPQVAALRAWQKCLGLGVLLIMLNETLRVIFIVGVITTAWTYTSVDIGQGAFAPFLLGILVALVAPRTTSWWQQALATLLIAAVMFFGVRPLVAAAFKPLLAAMAHLNHAQVYASTSWQLNTAACIGIVEPTLASFVMVALVWPRLSGRLLWRAGQFALLLALIDRVFFTAFYYPFFASSLSVPLAMLSAGQFTLEWLTLGFLTALTWHLSYTDLGQSRRGSQFVV